VAASREHHRHRRYRVHLLVPNLCGREGQAMRCPYVESSPECPTRSKKVRVETGFPS
jgi:hypothetical protein